MGSFAYVLGVGSISAYDVQSDGNLTPLGESVPVTNRFNNTMCACGDTVFAMSPDDGSDAYLDIYQADRISGRLFPRVQGHRLGNVLFNAGAMAATSLNGEAFYIFFPFVGKLHSYMYSPRFKTVLPVGQLDRPGDGVTNELALDKTGRTLYASQEGRGHIVASYGIKDNGMPVSIDRAPHSSASAFSLAVDPNQKFVYLGNLVPSEVFGYKINDGMFTPLAGVAEHTIGVPSAMTISDDGKYVFLCTGVNPIDGTEGNTVASYSIHPETGFLTPINVQNDDSLVVSMAVTQDGKYLYAASDKSDEIYRYAIDNGKLSPRSIAAHTGMKDNQQFILVSEN